MNSVQGGRPSLGKDGENRTSVSIVGQGERFNLSVLSIKREFLTSVGDGNRSEGFRKIIRFLAESARVYDLLENAITSPDSFRFEERGQWELDRWLKELDGILEHGRTDETPVDAETSASAG